MESRKKASITNIDEIVFIIREAHLHSRLAHVEEIPKLLWFGNDENYYYMVLPLLSGSFRQIHFNLDCEKEIWTRTGQQMLNAVKALHSHGYIHRDIKPDNFMFDHNGKLYLIDLGMCKQYLKNGQHVAPKIRNTVIGTANYISLNIHNMKEPSRRDDVESVCYVMWKMCGGLDWGEDPTDNLSTIQNKKIELTRHPGIPPELLSLLIKTRMLDYYEDPCYKLL
jgi:serine/threonine protein kinase